MMDEGEPKGQKSSILGLPELIQYDGQLVPLEPDVICSDLFQAGNGQGLDSPLLARELTDSVLFFLSQEYTGKIPLWEDLLDVVEKTVRELGYPQLAAAYREVASPPNLSKPIHLADSTDQERNNWEKAIDQRLSWQRIQQIILQESWNHYSKRHLYPSEFLAADQEGLLQLTDWFTPLELAGGVLPDHTWSVNNKLQVLEAILIARDHFGQFLAFDSPEYILARGKNSLHLAEDFVRELKLGLSITHFGCEVHLNCPNPSGTDTGNEFHTLFHQGGTKEDPIVIQQIRHLLIQNLIDQANITIYWHIQSEWLQKRSRFLELDLALLSTLISQKKKIIFVLDIVNRPVSLGPGLDRVHPSLLGYVGVNLQTLASQLADHDHRGEFFLSKLISLARFAKSVGHIRQRFLRQNARPSVQAGFRLDRSTWLIDIQGLPQTTQILLGTFASSPGKYHDYQIQIIKKFNEAILQDRTRFLDTVIAGEGVSRKNGILDFQPANSITRFDLDKNLFSDQKQLEPLPQSQDSIRESSIRTTLDQEKTPDQSFLPVTTMNTPETLRQWFRYTGQFAQIGDKGIPILSGIASNRITPEILNEWFELAFRYGLRHFTIQST